MLTTFPVLATRFSTSREA